MFSGSTVLLIVQSTNETTTTKESKAFAKKHNLKYQIYTVFSASNYSDGDNQGAVLTFSTLERPKVFRFR